MILDVEIVNTPGHPQCDGQSEKSVEQIKKMISAYCDENQETWVLRIFLCEQYLHPRYNRPKPIRGNVWERHKNFYSFNVPKQTRVHKNPILDNKTVERSEIGSAANDPNEKFQSIDILKDISPEEIEPKCPAQIKRYIEEKRYRILASYALLNHNRMLKLSRAQRNDNLRTKRTHNEIGD